MLIEHGADINQADELGQTPLAHAERKGAEGIAHMLRAAGAK